ncbi:MAG: hypothetical protein WBQ22_01040 [Bradyrhizobium sp.]|jgi:hypothetical protein|uniref:hypothetical protein n=1 Tax=Bradyrhizobium sp. TaxID=376 RepID=UPI003C663548
MIDLAFFPPEKSVLTAGAHTPRPHDARQKDRVKAKVQTAACKGPGVPVAGAGPALADDACAATGDYRPKRQFRNCFSVRRPLIVGRGAGDAERLSHFPHGLTDLRNPGKKA